MEFQTRNAAAPEASDDAVPRPRVLVGADDSPGARAAIAYAFAAAARRHAALDVVTAYPVNLPWPWDAALDVPDVEEVRNELRRKAEELRSTVHGEAPAVADVPVRVLVGRGTAAAVLVEESRRADLLVVGNRGRGEVRSALLGSVALHSVMAAQCPVVVVHQAAAGDGLPRPRTEPAQPARVVVGVDGSPGSKAALAAALGEAAAMDAVVDAVAVYSLVDVWTDHPGTMTPTDDEVRARAHDRLTATVEEVRTGLPAAVRARLRDVRTFVLDGQPVDALLGHALGARLLVVGSRGHSPLTGLVLGSVAIGCALHGTCPVMVVHATAVPTAPAEPVREPTPV